MSLYQLVTDNPTFVNIMQEQGIQMMNDSREYGVARSVDYMHLQRAIKERDAFIARYPEMAKLRIEYAYS